MVCSYLFICVFPNISACLFAVAAFANGGYYREPYIFKNMIGNNGEITAYYKNETNNNNVVTVPKVETQISTFSTKIYNKEDIY